MEKRYTIGVMIGNANSPHTMNLMQGYKQFPQILYLICDYPHKHYTFKHFEV